MAKLNNHSEKTLIRNFNKSIMSIGTFLNYFCNIRDENGIEYYNITHLDVKELFPYIKRSSYHFALKNPDLIRNGNILLVKDYNSRTIPYYRPTIFSEIVYNKQKTLNLEKISYNQLTK